MNKIAAMPPPLVDEPFSHWCGRYVDMWAYAHMSHIPTILFGCRLRSIPLDFPSHLSNFVDVLPADHQWSVKRIAYEHTHYPYVAPFLSKERSARLIKWMGENKSTGHIHSAIGIRASRIQSPNHIVYCQSCVNEQRKDHWEPYWQRHLQVPGVLMCPVHSEILCTTSIPHHTNPSCYLKK